MEIKHQKQEEQHSCGSTCFAMLTGLTQKEAKKACRTNYRGTSDHNVFAALRRLNKKFRAVRVDNDFNCIKTDLRLLSHEYPIYVSAVYRSRYNKKGRDSLRRHAILIYDEKIYDPSEPFELDLDAYNHTYNKSLFVRSIIIVGIGE